MSESAFAGDRIAKVLARAGVCSRRDAEKLIAEGRVKVDGKVIDSPALNVTAANRIEVNGKPLPQAEPPRLWLYHKPAGLVTTHRDPQGRTTVFASLPKTLPRVISVGRLDYSSEGLLLLTNDGGLARKLELPATGWVRRYRVRSFGRPSDAAIARLQKGMTIDGVEYGPIEVTVERDRGDNSWLVVSLREGKNREIRKVLEHFGHQVSRLIRVAYGPFQLGQLGEGAVREVSPKVLREQLGGARKQGSGAATPPARSDASGSRMSGGRETHAHRRRQA
jgi:23S rRNA pseudouridine2605 synthase